MDLVSIIVPVYNATQYIDRCINSILKQTYIHWELILVDDGSKDSSFDICKEWASKDSRIYAYHKDNSGVSDTRNYAIKMSKGNYLTFIDVDDWVNMHFLEDLMEYKSFDWVIEGHEFWPSRAKSIYKDGIIDIKGSKEQLDICLFNHPSGWSTLFNANIIRQNNIQFNTKLRSREDHLFNLQYFEHCNTIKILNKQDYNVQERVEPIALKFKMHREDIIEAIECFSSEYNRIAAKWNLSFNNVEKYYSIMSQYYLDDFLKFNGDNDYFLLYKKYFDCSSLLEMYTNVELSSITLILDGIIACNQINNQKKKDQLVHLFKTIFTKNILKLASFRNKTYRNIAWAIITNDNITLKIQLLKLSYKSKVLDFIKKNLRPLFYYIKYR